ncbi:hypothetical protein [Pontibacillus yanchengensis]|nr:hypothetical protein [Pontibacillus yanchengensis]
MIRSVIIFVLFFLIMFVIRWIIYFIQKTPYNEKESLVLDKGSGNANQKNQNVEDELSHHEEREKSEREDLSDEEAKKTSEMIRELLNNDDR